MTKIICSIPASRASSTAYWISGRSTTVIISLGMLLVAGSRRVPRPATGNTALRTRLGMVPYSPGVTPVGSVAGWLGVTGETGGAAPPVGGAAPPVSPVSTEPARDRPNRRHPRRVRHHANRVRKAVFSVAGLGTRLLPATKSIPKEMITVVDRPLIDTRSTRRAKPGSSS